MGQLQFNDENHEYSLDGLKLPSVTQIIKEILPTYTNVSMDILEYKADIGRKVHLATELYDMDELDMDNLDLYLQEYLDGWIKFKEDYQFVVKEIEVMLYHPIYLFTGRIDRIGTLGNDKVLLDIKSGMQQKTDIIQTAGYQILYDEWKKPVEQIKKRMCIYLKGGGYKVRMHTDKTDRNIFLSCLSVYNFKK